MYYIINLSEYGLNSSLTEIAFLLPWAFARVAGGAMSLACCVPACDFRSTLDGWRAAAFAPPAQTKRGALRRPFEVYCFPDLARDVELQDALGDRLECRRQVVAGRGVEIVGRV
jgi:hypothetical protein